jgi:endonuclease YncB( thermonuclease family)
MASTGPAAAQVSGVASVIDGDTIEIHGQRIRLSGYDTPESGKSCGSLNVYQKAALALSDFIGTKTVTCVGDGKDSYGRLVASCSVGGIDLGDYIVGQGWGRDWPRYSKGKYADEEASARSAKRGIWGMSCPQDLWNGRTYE